MDAIWQFVQHHFQTNPFFSGGFILAIFGSAVTVGRKIPSHLWFYVKKKSVATIELLNHDDLYEIVLRFLTSCTSVKNSKALTVYSKWTDEGRSLYYAPSPGIHFLWYKGRPIWVTRERKEDNSGSGTLVPKESVQFLTWFNESVLQTLLDDAVLFHKQSSEGKLSIYRHGLDYWGVPMLRERRKLNSVVLKAGQTEEIVSDIRRFINEKDWYFENGIPYHRGYLFYGPPGCGKSSLVAALASDLSLNVCVINLSGVSDSSITQLFGSVPKNSIILMEDIDAAFVKRKASEDDKPTISFSGLLNALDGISSVEGTIIIMTTNHKEKLDEALIRPGRIDVQVEFGYTDRYQTMNLFRKFYGGELAEQFADTVIEYGALLTPAKLQQYFMKYRDKPALALERVSELVKIRSAAMSGD